MESQAQEGDEVRLALAGELTLACAHQLRADLLRNLEQSRPVVLDLQPVTEVDLAGIQVLAAAERSFRTRGVRLSIRWGQAVEQAWNEAGYPRGE